MKTISRKIIDILRDSLETKPRDFTKGSIRRALILLSIPVVLEMAMEALFAIVDIFFISRLDNEAAVTAIGLTETFMFVVMSVALGLSMPATAIVARRIGEKDNEGASSSAFQAIVISIIIALLLGAIGVYFAKDLLLLMGAQQEVLDAGLIYTQIILGLNVIMMLLYVNNAIFRGAGDANIAMRTLWLANGLNIILDPILIFGLGPITGMGIQGAAIATCIGRGVGVLYQFYHLFNGHSLIKLAVHKLRLQFDIIFQILKMSIGGAGQHLLTTASWIFIASILADFGTESFAGYTYAMRVIAFTILPGWGVAMAAASLVGQNLGAGQPDRAEKSVWLAAYYNMIFLATISLIFFIAAEHVIGVFTQDPIALKSGSLALKVILAGYIFYAYEMVIGQAFNGAGDTITPTVLNFICFWLIQIPLSYILAKTLGYGPIGVYASISIASSILAILAIVIFRKGKWKKVKV